MESEFQTFNRVRARALEDLRKKHFVVKRVKVGKTVWIEILRPINYQGYLGMLIWDESNGQFIGFRLRVWRKILKQMLKWDFGEKPRTLSIKEKIKVLYEQHKIKKEAESL